MIRNAIAIVIAFFGAAVCGGMRPFDASSEPLQLQSSVEPTPQSFPNREVADTASTFDVASVKPSTSNGDPASRFALGPGDAYASGGVFSAINQPLIVYLRFAFKLGANDLPDLPAWVYTDRFDIEARSTANPTKDQMRLMMQSVLVDRFKMKAHIKQQTRPVFELVLARRGRPGPQLRPHPKDEACVALGDGSSAIACGTAGPAPARLGGNGRLVGRGVSIARLAALFTNPFTGVDRPVVDRTGLAGTFDFDVEWCLPTNSAPVPGAPVEVCEPTFRQAIEDQLGLSMKRSTGSIGVRVIDHIERPSAN